MHLGRNMVPIGATINDTHDSRRLLHCDKLSRLEQLGSAGGTLWRNTTGEGRVSLGVGVSTSQRVSRNGLIQSRVPQNMHTHDVSWETRSRR